MSLVGWRLSMNGARLLWMKVLFRLVAAVNVGLAIFGAYEMLHPLLAVLNGFRPSFWSPYFVLAFWAMMTANIVFLAFFCAGAYLLFSLKPSGVALHSLASVLLIAYTLLISVPWARGNGTGPSIAAASGIANLGAAPFVLLFYVPLAYPILSTGLLQLARVAAKHVSPEPS
jgi:hypothetical protein